MLVIGFAGEAGSGKGEAIDYLVDKKGAVQYRFSKILVDILDRLSIEQTRKNMTGIAMKLRELFGEEILARVIINDIQKEMPALAVIDGVRFNKEVEELRKITPIKIVAITTSPDIRHERITKRTEKEEDKGMSRKEFDRIASLPTEVGIKEIIKNADATIDNNGSRNALYKKLDKHIDTWLSK